jgi:predicted acylesterase/phospholipase RssA
VSPSVSRPSLQRLPKRAQQPHARVDSAKVEADSFSISASTDAPTEIRPDAKFPRAEPSPRSLLWSAHDLASRWAPRAFGGAVGLALQGISKVTEQGTGLNVKQLVDAERTLYQTLVPSRLGHVGGSPPIFQALADGQAAYVHMSKNDAYHADHLTRLYSGLSAEKLLEMEVPQDDRMMPVHKVLRERIGKGSFPAYVNVDGNLGEVTPTESIVMESISSIAKKENQLSTMQDPTLYYKWLVTRVESAYRQIDPWMYAITPNVHERVAEVKDSLTPSWITEPTSDPLGWLPSRKDTESAYGTMMELAGDSELSSTATLVDFADAAVTLDRDLLFATQTYWIKLLREVSPEQRETLLLPLAKGWVGMNTVPPDDPTFKMVSPENAPYIQLFDRRSNKVIQERYDRAMSLSEVVDHTLDGLGIKARRDFSEVLMKEINGLTDQIVARERRVRDLMGRDYRGLDVRAILDGRVDASNPEVRAGLNEMRRSLEGQGDQRAMTTRRAEVLRHVDILDWVATRESRYGNTALQLLNKLPELGKDPLIVSEYWRPDGSTTPTPLPPLKKTPEILGNPDGQEALPVSVVLQGGGGKGFAYVEALRQLKKGLSEAKGQVAVDRFVGNSAGALTAGLLASGYSPDEVGNVLEELDFKKFYADYLWLGGGVDPEVRGVDRTGMFTVRQMYRSISELLERKINVSGRPVLFRDLPVDLKVTSTVLNSDLPPELQDQFDVGEDGMVVFSSENTPNMDVAAAMCASAAVPIFFAAPQLHLARMEDGEPKEYRMQMLDGGVVNNFPVSEALDNSEQNAVMVSPPVYYETEGKNPTRLSTLNFDQADLAVIDKYNEQRYKEFTPQLSEFLQKAQDDGRERAVLALRLTKPDDQPSPLVQGRDKHATDEVRALAEQVDLPIMGKKAARIHMRKAFTGERGYAKQVALDQMLDKGNVMVPSFWGTPQYRPGTEEAVDLSDVLIGTLAAQTVGGHTAEERLFEKG